MVGMVAKFNEISMNSTKIFIGVFMAIHLIVNGIIAAIVNGNNSDKDTKKGSLIAHTIVSIIVFVLLIFVMKTGLFPFVGKLVKQDLFNKGFKIISFPMLIHLAVSIGFTIASFIEEDDTSLKNLSNIFNGLSTAVCSIIIVLCFVSAKTLIGMEEAGKKMKDKALAKTKAAAPTEGPATENPVAETPPETKTTDTTATDAATTTDTTTTDAAKEFGKRQRRRNPPKRRRRKKKY